jgi:hypothetical protein
MSNVADSPYIVWNGKNEMPYCETPGYQDMLCLYDGMMSIQEIRQVLLKEGCVITTIFACCAGGTVIELPSNGLFTQSYTTLLKQKPDVTIRDAVRLINESIHKQGFEQGFEQTCEAICRRDVLDLPIMQPYIEGAKHALCLYDMCRSKPA